MATFNTLLKFSFLLINLFLSKNLLSEEQSNIQQQIDSLIATAQHLPDTLSYEVFEILEKATLLVKENDEDSENFLKIGNLFSKKNKIAKAMELFDIGLSKAISSSDTIMIWEFYDVIGVIYHKNGEYSKSLDYLFKGLKLAEKARNKSKAAISCDHIVRILRIQKDYSKALEYLEKSLNLKIEIEDMEGELTTSITIADLNALLKNFDKAIAIYKKSERLAVQLSIPTQLSRIYSNMGNCYLSIKDYPKAEGLFLKGIEIKEEIGDKYRLAIAYNNLSIFYKRISKLDEAYKAATKSLELSKEISAAYIERSCYKSLAHYYTLTKNFDSAYYYRLKFYHLHDSLFNKEISKQLAEIREKYETEKKEQQIELLEVENRNKEMSIQKNRTIRNAIAFSGTLFLLLAMVSFYAYRQKRKANKTLNEKNAQIHEQNIELEQLNATKNKLFSIIAHDLRSPLSSLEGVYELIDKLLKQDNREQLLKLASHVDQSISNVNTLLDNLLNWALSQVERLHVQFEKLNVAEVVQYSVKIQSEIAKSKNMNVKTSIDAELYVHADLNLFRTILRNLLSNAIKFSPEGETIEIAATKAGEMVQVEVSDHGQGIDENTLQNIFSINQVKTQKGTKGEKGSGLGLMLCKEFVTLNKGTIEIKSKKNKGTTVKFTLPLYT